MVLRRDHARLWDDVDPEEVVGFGVPCRTQWAAYDDAERVAQRHAASLGGPNDELAGRRR